jgi:IS6 family transposase
MVGPWRLQRCRTRHGFDVHRHTTVFRWVQRYAPELDKLCCLHLKTTNGSYKVKSCWVYLYHTVDSTGTIIDFLFSAIRDTHAATHFFRRVLRATHAPIPRVITINKHAVYPPAFDVVHQKGSFPRRALFGGASYK